MDKLVHNAFRRDLLDHEKWRRKYDELLAVATLVEPKVKEYWQADSRKAGLRHFVAAFFMLQAYALENLLKAMLIQAQKGEFLAESEQKGRIPKAIQNHRLVSLWELCALPELGAEERGLLGRLERCAVWQGRYPVPLLKRDVLLTVATLADGSQGMISSSYYSTDAAVLERIHQTASQAYREITSGSSGR